MSSEYLKQLHQKISEFSGKTQAKYNDAINCKSGCYKCCLVDLSVFEVEAKLIKSWFENQSLEAQNSLRAKWNSKQQIEEENFHGQMSKACSFLVDGSCSIYETRPVICRTQGLPLLFQLEESFQFDTCPLNFTETRPASKECLGLDQLNLMLSQIEKSDSQGRQRDRISLRSLLEEFTAP